MLHIWKPYFYNLEWNNFEILRQFSLTSAKKAQSRLVFYLQVWRQSWSYNALNHMFVVKFNLYVLLTHLWKLTHNKYKSVNILSPIWRAIPIILACSAGVFFEGAICSRKRHKMAATTTLRTRTRFRPTKIRLQCRLLLYPTLNWKKLSNKQSIATVGEHG